MIDSDLRVNLHSSLSLQPATWPARFSRVNCWYIRKGRILWVVMSVLVRTVPFLILLFICWINTKFNCNSAFIFWWKKRHPQQRRWHRICRKPTGQLRAQWRTNARWLTRSRRGNLQERFLQTAQEIWRLLHHSRTESQRRLPHSQREQDGCTDQHLLWKWIQRIQILKQHQKW